MSINSPVCAGLGGTGGDISFPLSDVFLASFPLSRLQLLGVEFTAGREWKNCHRHQHFQFSDLPFSMRVKIDKTPNNSISMPEKLSWLHLHLQSSQIAAVNLMDAWWMHLALGAVCDQQWPPSTVATAEIALWCTANPTTKGDELETC